MKTLEVKDFEHKDKYSSFKSVGELWGSDYVNIYIDFPEEHDIDECLNASLSKINELLLWLESNKNAVAKALIDDDYVEMAEDWASSADEADDEQDECYIMEDGQKVFFPITEKDFVNSLRLENISINFEEEVMDEPEVELYIVCSPDYFAGHCIQATIDADKNIDCHGLAG